MSTTTEQDVMFVIMTFFCLSVPLCYMLWPANKDDRHE